MKNDVVLVFEPLADIHWMKDVVQLPIAIAKKNNLKAYAIVRPNHKQKELSKYINLSFQGIENEDNYLCFENSDFSSVKVDFKWYRNACKKASELGQILILYPFFGDHLKGAMLYKLMRWLKFRRAFVIIKSDGTLKDWNFEKIGFIRKLKDHLNWFFIDKIICESEEIYSRLRSINHHLFFKIILMPNCPINIYNEQTVIEFEARKNEFLFVGRISDLEKGVDILIEAWLKIFNQLPNWKLILVGPCSNEFKTIWEERVLKKNASDSVVWIGNASPIELIKYYQDSKVVILSSRKEGAPIVISEAALTGCAFIGTAVGEIPNVLDGLPGLVNNPKELEEMMLLFAKDPTTAKRQANELNKRMKNRNWNEQVKKIKIS